MNPKNIKGKCKFCGKEIDSTCIRCSKCDLAWQDGLKCGKEEIKEKISNQIKSWIN